MKVGSQMKKLLFVILACIVVTLGFILTGCGGYWGTGDNNEGQPGQSACGDDKDLQWSKLDVEIITQPQGGMYVNNLTCTFKVTYTWEDQKYWNGKSYDMPAGMTPDRGPNEIGLHPYWFNGEKRYEQEKMVFDMNHTGGVYTISLQPPKAGLYFDKTFEADFGWTDINKDHNLSSKPAVCTVK